MLLDDPETPAFVSWMSYRRYARNVQRIRRYVWNPPIQSFLDTVKATLKDRDLALREGTILFRAQRGIDYQPIRVDDGEDVGEQPAGFGAERMRPLQGRAKEGRVNSAGIPVLYLASSEETAISEVRPWVGSEVSVAQFRVQKALRALDLTQGHYQRPGFPIGHLLNDTEPDPKEREQYVWADIDAAFSEPVTLTDDSGAYVPTQILAELFQHLGYEAIVYGSQFGEGGKNVALFNVDCAEVINCAPYQVKGIKVSFQEIGNRWYSSKHYK